jgi:hypothetical protein
MAPENHSRERPADRDCPYCGGSGKVHGHADDVELVFTCPCTGGNEQAARWLLSLERRPRVEED